MNRILIVGFLLSFHLYLVDYFIKDFYIYKKKKEKEIALTSPGLTKREVF